MTSGQVAFRLIATAAADEGRGHLARAFAVGEALAARGARTEIRLLRGNPTSQELRAASNAGIGFVAEAPSAHADSDAADAGIVTYVDLPDPDTAAAHGASTHLVVMDDGDRFTGEAAIVIQPSQRRWTGTGRAGLILAGYEVVPLAAIFKDLRAISLDHPARAGRTSVLACFGGSDPARVTERLATSLAGSGWGLDLVIGASYRGPTAGWPVEPIRDPRDLPQRLAAADVLVLAAGTMKFEAACLGRPAILLAVADDQLAVGPPFAATGAAEFLGDGRIVDPESVHAAIEDLVEDRERRVAMGRRAAELIDGDGADRIAAAMWELASAPRP